MDTGLTDTPQILKPNSITCYTLPKKFLLQAKQQLKNSLTSVGHFASITNFLKLCVDY